MNNKAFTLIELLGVLMIIAIIATVVTVTVDRSIKNSRVKTCEAQEKNIIEAAKNWMTDNPTALALNGLNTKPINVYINNNSKTYTLQGKGYIEENLESPMTGDPYSPNTYVEIKISKYTDSNNKIRQNYEYKIVYGISDEECTTNP